MIYIDFDGTCVDQDGVSDINHPLTLRAGALMGLRALKNAGHKLVLWSARMSPVYGGPGDLLVRKGVRQQLPPKQLARAEADIKLRRRQMIDFVYRELPDIFDAIDDGRSGKPHGDLFIDDKAVGVGKGSGLSWSQIAYAYGELAQPNIWGRAAAGGSRR